MKTWKKLLSVIMCVLLTSSLIVSPTAALTASEPAVTGQFEGKIVLDESITTIPALSDIEIQVYTLLDVQEYGDGTTTYNKEYVFSVFTDATGRFSLEKPDGAFELFVRKDTLPEGFGLSSYMRKYVPTDTKDEFVLKLAESENEDTSIVGELDSRDPISKFIEPGAEYQTSKVIFAENGITISGTMSRNDKVEAFSNVFAFDEADPRATVEMLYKKGLLSKEQQMEQYCNLLDANLLPEGYCLNPIVWELQAYLEPNSEAQQELPLTKNSVQDRIATTLATLAARPELPNVRYSTYFAVHYAASANFTDVTNVMNFLDSIYETSRDAGFNVPLRESTGERIHVYLSPNANGNLNGQAFPVTITTSGNGCSGYIEIYNFTTLSNGVKETIAHEFFHLVEFSYKASGGYTAGAKWFLEATAVWFSLKYTDSMERAITHLRDTFRYLNQTIDAMTSDYAAGPYIMAIDLAYGGTSVIEDILYRISLRSNTVTNDNIRDDITTAIQAQTTSGSFVEAYKLMGRYLTYPLHFYASIIPGTMESWTVSPLVISETSSPDLASETLQPMGCLISGYTSNGYGNEIELQIAIDFSAGNQNGYCIVKKLVSGGYTYTPWITTNSATISIPNFSSVVEEVFVVQMNTALSGSTILAEIFPQVA